MNGRAAPWVLLALVLGMVLSGCGYRLRDDATLTTLLSAPRIIDQTGDRELVRALRRRLRDHGAQIDPPAAAASGEIRLLQASLARESLSVGIAGQVDEVRLIYTLSYRFGPAGADPTAWRRHTVTVHDDYRFDAAALLSAAAEARQLRHELKHRAARRVITHIRLAARAQ